MQSSLQPATFDSLGSNKTKQFSRTTSQTPAGGENNVLMKSKSLLIDMDELAKVEATAKDMHSHRTGKRLLLLAVNIVRNYRRKSEMVLTSVLRDLQQQV